MSVFLKCISRGFYGCGLSSKYFFFLFYINDVDFVGCTTLCFDERRSFFFSLQCFTENNIQTTFLPIVLVKIINKFSVTNNSLMTFRSQENITSLIIYKRNSINANIYGLMDHENGFLNV